MKRAWIVLSGWLLLSASPCSSADRAATSRVAGEKPPAEWPQFRGPTGQGHATARDLPVTWSETENVAWKSELPGRGWSSPVLRGNRIWLTAGDPETKTLRAFCLDRRTGEIRLNVVINKPSETGTIHGKNSLASPTPILEDDRVYVHFGPYGTACLSDEGEILWSTTLPHLQSYGPSSSPVLQGDQLIVPCLGTDERFLVALDKRDGSLCWKKPIEGRNAESTPLVIDTDAGPQLVSNQADRIVAFDPKNGQELWWVTQTNFAQIPRPVAGHGLVFVGGGYFKPEVWAIRPEGRGDVTESHVVWRVNQAAPLNPSPLLVGDELYFVSDNGIASCVDARTGKLHWRERLGGEFTASPLFADGRIYFLNETGTTTVVSPGEEFKQLAANELPGRTLASMAAVGRALYLRTDSHLYRLEKPQ
ncbi:MAG: PQQ-binding-like beta-propeller repeat protein [Planctomycetales bacterium]